MILRSARLLAIPLSGMLLSSAEGAVTLPTWFGDPGTTSQTFLFNSDTLTPSPNTSANPYGTASGTVDVGFFGNGWENPAAPPSNPGHDKDGAWDVGAGADGSITISVPIAPGPPSIGDLYRIDIEIYAVAYQDLQKIPVLTVGGTSPGDIVLNNSGVLSTQVPNGSWEYRTWTTTIQGTTSDTITLALTPPNNAVSVIDRMEIYTRYTLIPEPTLPLIGLISLSAFSLLRRR